MVMIRVLWGFGIQQLQWWRRGRYPKRLEKSPKFAKSARSALYFFLLASLRFGILNWIMGFLSSFSYIKALITYVKTRYDSTRTLFVIEDAHIVNGIEPVNGKIKGMSWRSLCCRSWGTGWSKSRRIWRQCSEPWQFALWGDCSSIKPSQSGAGIDVRSNTPDNLESFSCDTPTREEGVHHCELQSSPWHKGIKFES